MSKPMFAGPAAMQAICPEPLLPEHLTDLAELHFRQLHWSFNGQFGPAHILELYEALSASEHFFGYVYYNKGRLIGFVTATTDFEDTRRRVLSVYKRKVWRMLKIFIRYPRFLLTALESQFVVPLVFKRYHTKSEWLTFVTDTEVAYLSPLVALRLIDVLRENFRKLGVRAYMAQGFKNNPKAMRLYEKLRWQIAARLVMYNIYLYPTE